MRLLLLWSCVLLPGSRALKGPKEISGFEGDTISVRCSYEETLKEHQKYWCRRRGLFLSRCSGTIYSGEDGQEVVAGQVSIRDNHQELAFTVTLRDLTREDEGEYWCGVRILGFDKTFLVSLIIFPGSSRLATQLDFTSAKGTSPKPSSSSSKSRVSVPMIRILAPVFVLLSLLLATGLVVLGSFMLRRRREAHEAMEPEKNQQVHLSQLVKKEEPGCIPEYAVVKLADPCASHKPSEPPNTELQCLSQTSEEEEASSQDPQGENIPVPLHYLSEEELYLSEFIPV